MIVLTRLVHRQVQFVLNHKAVGNNEVAIFGKVRLQNGFIWITDIHVPPQEVGGASTEMDAAELAIMYTGLIEADEDISDWRCWIHKHPGGGTKPTSGVDNTTLEALAKQFSSSEEVGKHYAVGIIASGTGAYGGYIHQCFPFDLEITDVKVLIESEAELPKEIVTSLEEMLEGVREAPKAVHQAMWNQQARSTKPSSQRKDSKDSTKPDNKGFVMPRERHDQDSMTRVAWSNKWGSELGQTLDDMKEEARDDLFRVWVIRDLNNLLEDADYKLVVGGNQIIRGLHRVRDREARVTIPTRAEDIHKTFHTDNLWPGSCTYCTKELQKQQSKKVTTKTSSKASRKGGK